MIITFSNVSFHPAICPGQCARFVQGSHDTHTNTDNDGNNNNSNNNNSNNNLFAKTF